MRASTAVRLLPVLAGLSLMGCGDSLSGIGQTGGGGCGVLGTSNITVSGGANATLNACATFAVIPASGTTPARFTLNLTAGSSSAPTHLLTITREGTRPTPATYNVGTTTGSISGALNLDESTGDRTFLLTGGSITITTSGTAGVVGTVNLTATDATPTSVTITGSFSARCIDTPSSDC